MKVDVVKYPEDFAAHVADVLIKRLAASDPGIQEWRRAVEFEDNDSAGEIVRIHYNLDLPSGTVRVSSGGAGEDEWYYAVTVSREGVEIGRAEFGEEGLGVKLFDRIEALIERQKQPWAEAIAAEVEAL